MKVVFFGTPEFAVPTLTRLLTDQRFTVQAVVTQPDKRRGRGNQVTPSPVKELALKHDLPIWQPERIKKDQPTLEFLESCQADVFVVVAYGQIVSQKILDMPRLGCVNVHGSLLPKYRGAAPIQWCLYQGETETGNTTMLMDAGMDTGAMLLKSQTPIHLFDNAWQLAETLSQTGADLLIETLEKLETQQLAPIPQEADAATYAPLITKADYELDWQKGALQLHNQVRGFFPNCTTQLRGKPLKIGATIPLLDSLQAQFPPEIQSLLPLLAELPAASPGVVVYLAKGLGPVVQTGDGYLLLQQVQPSGKRMQAGWDFVNGMRLQLGEMLTSGGD